MRSILRAADAAYTVVMLTFWYGLFFGVWPVLAIVVLLLWANGAL
jgi:hypothetical protein